MAHSLRRVVALIALVAATTIALATPSVAGAVTKLMVVGDSISQGSAGDFTWRYRLWKHLQATAPPGTVDLVGDRTALFDNVSSTQGATTYADSVFDQDHHAIWGRALKDEKLTIATAVSATAPDVLLVMLGTNDLAYFSTPDQARDDMRALITAARGARPGVDVVVGHVYPRWDLWSSTYVDSVAVAAYNSRLDALASSMNTASERVATATTDVGFSAQKDTWDGTHPGPVGEAKIAAAFAKPLTAWGIGGAYGTVPASIAWPWKGPSLAAAPVDKGLKLTWSAQTPGATGYLVETRNETANETKFSRLPYPVGGTTWTAGLLVPGFKYSFRLVPVKGLVTGQPGAAVTGTAGGATPAKPAYLNGSPGGAPSITTGATVNLSWGAAADASGYLIEQTDLATGATTELPYPVTTTSFSPGLLPGGKWYRWRIIPVNGAIRGPASEAVHIRTKGSTFADAYFALGDSYSSGTGAEKYLAPTECQRSSDGWAFKLGSLTPTPTGGVIACGGARTYNVVLSGTALPIDSTNADDQRVQPQFGASITPGTQTQILSSRIASRGRSDALVTLSIGGNDSGFSTELQTCFKTDCTGRDAVIRNRITSIIKPRLITTYRQLRAAAPGADIVAVGYPLIVTADSHCASWDEKSLWEILLPTGYNARIAALNAAFTQAERLKIRQWVTLLNDTIDQAAATAGVASATTEVEQQFAGHEVCATNSREWINSIVVSLSEIPNIPIGPAAFHPNAAGNLAYAYAVNNRRTGLNATGQVYYPNR